MGEFGELRAEEWRRLLAAARRRLFKTMGEPAGSVALADPSPAERRLVATVTGRDPGTSRRVVVDLSGVDGMLRRAYGVGLLRVLALLDRPPDPNDRRTALELALRCRHAGEGWFSAWLSRVARDGTLDRLLERGDAGLLRDAAAVLDRLPTRDLPLPVLAEWATGDVTALSGTPLAELVLRALVLWQGAHEPYDRATEHAVWHDAGVLADDLGSQVLVLGLRVTERHMVGRWLDDAATSGAPFRLTLHQVMASGLTPDTGEIFVCASPMVVRAAAGVLGGRCPPLVCTEGRASVACHRLLGTAARVGARVRWRSDFDWPGLRTTTAAIHRYDALPWRMDAASYLAAVEIGPTLALHGPPAMASWDGELAATMALRGQAVAEERLLPALLDDLRAAGRPPSGR